MTYALDVRTTPNRSARIGAPHYLVVHSTEGSYAGSVGWLMNAASQVSADEVINTAGTKVTVLNRVSSRMKTWEVGNANSLCVGFELEGYAGRTHWPDSLYDTLADRLVRAAQAVRQVYGVTIPLHHSTRKGQAGIVSHAQVAAWYGGSDHTDPGPTFSWAKLEAALDRRLHREPPVTYTKRDKWRWAAWLTHRAGRPAPKHPRRIPKAWWAAVRWFQMRRRRAAWAEWVCTAPKDRGPEPPHPSPVPASWWKAVAARQEAQRKEASK